MKDGCSEAERSEGWGFNLAVLPILPSSPLPFPSLNDNVLFSSIASLHVSAHIGQCKQRQSWSRERVLNPNACQRCHNYFWNVFDQKLLQENDFQWRSSCFCDCQGSLTDISNPFAVVEESFLCVTWPGLVSNLHSIQQMADGRRDCTESLTWPDLFLPCLMKGQKTDWGFTIVCQKTYKFSTHKLSAGQ